MAAFTITMGYDIWKFGTNMSGNGKEPVPKAFGPAGKAVLKWICGLIFGGWILAALGALGHPPAWWPGFAK